MNRRMYILLFILSFGSAMMAQAQELNVVEDSLLQVVQIDSNNYAANYNLGMLYYEKAVEIIRATPYDVDLIALDKIQDESVELFRKALPFLQKAYQLNPAQKEVLAGLSALYFSLNELEKSEELEDRMKE